MFRISGTHWGNKMLSGVKTKKQSSNSDHYFPEVITRVLVIKMANMWHSSTVVGNEDVKILTDCAPSFGSLVESHLGHGYLSRFLCSFYVDFEFVVVRSVEGLDCSN